MRRPSALNQRHGQRGIALIVVLLLLVIVTLLGLASLRGAIMQERMAMNTYARSLAFQSAETGLREVELIAQNLGGAAFTGIAAGTCSATSGKQGLCVAPATGVASAWQASGFWDATSNIRYGTVGTATHGIQPRYVIEQYGTYPLNVGTATKAVDKKNQGSPLAGTFRVFRITVRSQAADGAEVLLQSMYRTP